MTTKMKELQKKDDQVIKPDENTPQLDLKLHGKFIDTLKARGLSGREASRRMEYSPGYISKYINLSFEGDIIKLETKVKEFLQQVNKMKVFKEKYIEIRRAKQITQALNIAFYDGDFVVITAPAGNGKTKPVQQFIKDKKHCYYIEMNPTYTKDIIIRIIAGQLNLETKGNYNYIAQNIEKKLKGSEATLIIDQVDFCDFNCLEIIRCLRDSTGIGIVMIGLPKFEAFIKNQKNDYDQLESRISFILRLDPFSFEEAKQVITEYFGECEDSIYNYLYESTNQSIRKLCIKIRNTYRVMNNNNIEKVTIAAIKAAEELQFYS